MSKNTKKRQSHHTLFRRMHSLSSLLDKRERLYDRRTNSYRPYKDWSATTPQTQIDDWVDSMPHQLKQYSADPQQASTQSRLIIGVDTSSPDYPTILKMLQAVLSDDYTGMEQFDAPPASTNSATEEVEQ